MARRVEANLIQGAREKTSLLFIPCERAAGQYLMNDNFPRLRDSVDIIQNVPNLCSALSINSDELNFLIGLDGCARYSKIKLFKPNGDIRVVYDPHPLLRRVQRRIKNRIFSNIVYPSYLYGSISDPDNPRDYIRCAAVHCSAKNIAKIDIKNFFDTISRSLVFRVFNSVFNYPEVVSDTLADLCTLDGIVPQGAPTSSFIANLCLIGEGDIYKDFSYRNIRYTRLVDDITLSSLSVNCDLSTSVAIIKRLIESHGFCINENKTVIESVSTRPVLVHGLNVVSNQPQLQKKEVKRIRAVVQELKIKASIPNARVSFEYRGLYESVSGQVNKLKRFNHTRYDLLRRQLSSIMPLPSKSDIKRCQLMLIRLQKDYEVFSNSYLYKRRYYRLSHRLGVLKRLYSREAETIRLELREIKPLCAHDD